jgi:hypothetical protein
VCLSAWPDVFVWHSAFKPGFRRTFLEVSREIVENVNKDFEILRKIPDTP